MSKVCTSPLLLLLRPDNRIADDPVVDASVAVEVVDYSTNATMPSSIMSKRELKTFMVCSAI